MKDDIEKAPGHELKLMQMMLSFQNQQPLQGQIPVSAPGDVGFASLACNGDGLYLPPAPHQVIQSAGKRPEITVDTSKPTFEIMKSILIDITVIS